MNPITYDEDGSNAGIPIAKLIVYKSHRHCDDEGGSNLIEALRSVVLQIEFRISINFDLY